MRQALAPTDTPTALELGARIARRELSSVEAVRATLATIRARDADVGAFVSVWDSALDEAARRDREPARGPFHGVPIAVKDLDVVGWSFTRFGSRATRWFWSPFDGPVAKRLRAAGFVIVGKTATSEFGAMSVTEPDSGPTRNPWSLDHTPGGSSGGAAAAVASGMLSIAQGSDGGGSIRIPAALCGLFGLKPARASAPSPYGANDPLSIAYVGPLARTVADGAALADVLVGRPVGSWTRSSARRRIRVGTTSLLGPTDPAIAARTLEVAALLERLGHEVAPAAPPVGSLDEFLPLWQYQVASVRGLPDGLLQPPTRWLRREGRRYDRAFVERRKAELVARVEAWLGDADAWLLPTVAVRTPEVGAWRSLDGEAAFRWAAFLGAMTAPFNLSGHAAASVPAGTGPDGMPIGAQVVGRSDDVVLDLAAELEEAMPWRHPYPAVQ